MYSMGIRYVGSINGTNRCITLYAVAKLSGYSGSDAIGTILRLDHAGFPFQYLIEIADYRGLSEAGRTEQLQFKVLVRITGLRVVRRNAVGLNRPNARMMRFPVRIQIVHLSRGSWMRPMEISGNFEIVLGDGRKLATGIV